MTGSWRSREVMIFGVIFLASYPILHEIAFVQSVMTDFGPHIGFVERYLTENVALPGHPLFHLLTALISAVSGAAAAHSAALLIAASIGLCAVIIDRLYFGSLLTEPTESFGICLVLVIVTLVSTAIWYPPPTPIYVGQSSPNVWHNPTGMLQKPFALLAAISVERMVFGQAGWRTFWVAAAAVVLSMLAKPAFATVLVPVLGALALHMIVPPRWRLIPERFLPTSPTARNMLLALLGITLVVLAVQTVYIYMYDRSWVKIIWAPLVVWSRHSFSIPRSIALVLAFPIAVTLLDLRRGVPLHGLAIAWMFTITGMAIFALLAESGRPMLHGNFSWGYQIALSVLFAFAMRSYLRHWREHRWTWGFSLTTLLLAAHAITGVYYLYRILVVHEFD